MGSSQQKLASGGTAKQSLASVTLGSPPTSDLASVVAAHPTSALFPQAIQAAKSTSHGSPTKPVTKSTGKPAIARAPSKSSAGSATTSVSQATTLTGEINLKDKVQQAFTVGSHIISFDDSVTAARKSAAINSTLLAELNANRLYPNRKEKGDADNWYRAYFNTLINIGWDPQGRSDVKTFQGDSEVEVDKSIITLASALIGASGVVAIKAVLDSLKSLANNSPLITLFKKNTQSSHVAQFTVSLSSQKPNSGFCINAVAFDLVASVTETQILFFRWSSEHVSFTWRNMVLTVDDAVYGSVSDAIQKKIDAFSSAYVREIPAL